MKMCQKHWDMLRDAIKDRGLAHMVASNGREAAARLAKPDADGSDFDPLMAAFMMISGRAIEDGGLYLLKGDYCPVCEVMEYHPKNCKETPVCTGETLEKLWIDGPADAVRTYAEEHGLLAA
jgi:hypothetical protein